MRNLEKDLERFFNTNDTGDIAELANYVLPEAINRALAAERKLRTIKEEFEHTAEIDIYDLEKIIEEDLIQ